MNGTTKISVNYTGLDPIIKIKASKTDKKTEKRKSQINKQRKQKAEPLLNSNPT